MEPEANSIEIMSYTYDGTNRVFVDLSNYHEWWIQPIAGASLTVYNDELGSDYFTVLVNPSAATLHSAGNVWVTGYAALWIALDSPGPGNFNVMGIRRR